MYINHRIVPNAYTGTGWLVVSDEPIEGRGNIDHIRGEYSTREEAEKRLAEIQSVDEAPPTRRHTFETIDGGDPSERAWTPIVRGKR